MTLEVSLRFSNSLWMTLIKSKPFRWSSRHGGIEERHPGRYQDSLATSFFVTGSHAWSDISNSFKSSLISRIVEELRCPSAPRFARIALSIELFITELDGASRCDRCWSESFLFEYSRAMWSSCLFKLAQLGLACPGISWIFMTFPICLPHFPSLKLGREAPMHNLMVPGECQVNVVGDGPPALKPAYRRNTAAGSTGRWWWGAQHSTDRAHLCVRFTSWAALQVAASDRLRWILIDSDRLRCAEISTRLSTLLMQRAKPWANATWLRHGAPVSWKESSKIADPLRSVRLPPWHATSLPRQFQLQRSLPLGKLQSSLS